ncbi:hypothetical protein AVEN_257384-1 [Araneus ventricosus]|uniref:Uncharacterized protein n=1 Tax=Araneus ventricosus TaxID=182803 RepID=A0A4Y2C9N8_ARAVE|nr:hypothetical protein AVEN_257384-1 [Araneus ventricosus]
MYVEYILTPSRVSVHEAFASSTCAKSTTQNLFFASELSPVFLPLNFVHVLKTAIGQHHILLPPSPIMLPHRGGGGGPGWNGQCTSGVFSPSRVTQGVKAIPLYPAKA